MSAKPSEADTSPGHVPLPPSPEPEAAVPPDPLVQLRRWALDRPFATTGDPLPGRLRETPEDFQVEEIPAYSPSGEGDHLYVRFRKRGLDTKAAVGQLARALEVNPKETGFAGLKDRHAVTTQWASFLFGDAAKLEGVDLEGIEVLESARHGNKLRTGHLRGNRFRLRLRGTPAGAQAEAERRLAQLGRDGLPNFFGVQRFGRGADNLARAHAWLVEGGRAPRAPFQRKLLMSAWQSALFNHLLSERLRAGTYATVEAGDLARTARGGLFVVEAGDADPAERAERFEISATGPMFGSKMRWPQGDVEARERAVLEAAGLDVDRLKGFRKQGPGARRPYRVPLGETHVEEDAEGLQVAFDLPSGAYATVVMRELIREPFSE